MSMPRSTLSPMRGAAVGVEAADDLAARRSAGRRWSRRRSARPPRPARSSGGDAAACAPRGPRCVAEDVLGPDAEDHLRGPRRSGACRGPAAAASRVSPSTSGKLHRGRRRRRTDLGRDEVHRRRAHEAGDEEVGRAVVDRLRLVELLQLALVHDRDARGERHRLDLVVGDVDRGLADAVVQLLDLGAHLDAELGVEVGERLVEEEERRVADQRPAHGDALALAAGELAGLALQERLDLQAARRRARRRRPAPASGTRRLSMPKVMFSRTVIVG